MSNLSKLIKDLCPEGVEYKTLGEIGTFERGRRFVKADAVETGGIPCVHYGELYTHYGICANVHKSQIRSDIQTKLRYAEKNDVIIVGAGENNIDIGIAVAWLGNYKVAVHDACYIFKHQQDPQYISFLLRTNSYHQQIKKFVSEGKICSISAENLAKAILPFPPVPIQQEIVRILSRFTEIEVQLELELERELETRKLQYEYYRNKLLLSSPNRKGVKRTTLGEIMTISRGASPRPIHQYITDADKGIPWIKIGDVSPNTKYITQTKEYITMDGVAKSKFLKKGAFVLSNSMSFGRPYILKIDGCIHDGWISMINFEDSVIPDFLYHLLWSNETQKYWKQKASNGSIQNLNADIVRATPISIPSINEQERIVSILDRFETLTSDLQRLLKDEITARRQQYEYYREKLLTFKRKVA